MSKGKYIATESSDDLIKIGDPVTVVRALNSREKQEYFGWIPEMDKTVGGQFVVVWRMLNTSSPHCRLSNGFVYPLSVLKKCPVHVLMKKPAKVVPSNKKNADKLSSKTIKKKLFGVDIVLMKIQGTWRYKIGKSKIVATRSRTIQPVLVRVSCSLRAQLNSEIKKFRKKLNNM